MSSNFRRSDKTSTLTSTHYHNFDIMSSEMSTTTSRPMSEDSSFWEDEVSSSSISQVKRRNKNQQLQRPLTRYLPIRTDDLDLRHHIETAGHQIEFAQIVLNSSSCRGYLHKMGQTKMGGTFKRGHWNKRWFVFDRNKRTMVYYSDKSESKAKGGIYFQVDT